ncbi:50S ribosomal protein L25/general stress protein Ctc [Bacillus methanolicus]|uniref:50S ribosomal protein L25/general stress protein Ctc n=1 Tax=Bacillus methanolicus TaxID=1471 RepID=UPI00200C1FFE|nr:50S ribosomal protein L25/general stress protein Ctc [Bacillus methanolicus]UQD50674.1 50S ribosomal protein L25/general stress protein Ctc [Bacillus methanolicus]
MSAVLQAKERTEFRSSILRKLREQGNIPAVIYGSGVESKPIYVSAKDLIKTIRKVGRNGIISLDINGDQHQVILREYQEDPLKKELIHADFRAVDMSSEIDADVRIDLVGEAAGVKDGGVLQQPLHSLSITAKPGDIPNSIEVDVTNLQVGEALTIADIKADKPYQINHDEEEVICSILPPKQEEEISSGEKQDGGIPENEEGRETLASEE